MNYCTHGGLAMNIAPGTRCPWCSTQIVAADPMRQATRGEVGGDARHATEPAPREFAWSAPTPTAAPSSGRGPSSASQSAHTGADPARTPPEGLPARAARPSAAAGDSGVQGVLGDARGGAPADMGPQHGAPAHTSTPAPSLFDAIDATPRARVTDPDTAHQAAGTQAGRLTHDMRIVLAAHVAAGERGLTGPELATATRRTYEQIGPRRKPLEVAGLVEKAERRPKDPTQPAGSLVWAYRITDLGRDAYAREQARSNAA